MVFTMSKLEEIYPCTIAIDRYRGTYRDKYMFDDESMGMWTAWNLDAEQIPADSEAEDVECANFWFTESKEHRYVFGVGNTPNEALENLAEIIGGME